VFAASLARAMACWSAPAKHSGDGAFERTIRVEISLRVARMKSGVALRLQSKT
jgi:hypothetical protein